MNKLSAAPRNKPSTDGIRARILERIAEFRAATGISERRLGLDTVNDAHLVRRLRIGHGTQLSTLEKLETFMREETVRLGLGAPRGLV